ncbi:hypothetical protein D3C81_07590 [compost metagenome]
MKKFLDDFRNTTNKELKRALSLVGSTSFLITVLILVLVYLLPMVKPSLLRFNYYPMKWALKASTVDIEDLIKMNTSNNSPFGDFFIRNIVYKTSTQHDEINLRKAVIYRNEGGKKVSVTRDDLAKDLPYVQTFTYYDYGYLEYSIDRDNPRYEKKIMELAEKYNSTITLVDKNVASGNVTFKYHLASESSLSIYYNKGNIEGYIKGENNKYAKVGTDLNVANTVVSDYIYDDIYLETRTKLIDTNQKDGTFTLHYDDIDSLYAKSDEQAKYIENLINKSTDGYDKYYSYSQIIKYVKE